MTGISNRWLSWTIGAISIAIAGGFCSWYFLAGGHPGTATVASTMELRQSNSAAVPATNQSFVGIVRTTDGRPVAGALVLFATATSPITLGMGNKDASATARWNTLTTQDGRFRLHVDGAVRAIVVCCPQGFGFNRVSAPLSSFDVTVEPWGRIEGVIHEAAGVTPNARIVFSGNESFAAANIRLGELDLMDPGGHFVVEHAPAGKFLIGFTHQYESFARRWQQVEVGGNNTTRVQIGGSGRPVTGRINLSMARYVYKRARLRPSSSQRDIKAMEEINTEINSDGTFRLDDVPDGAYLLSIQCGGFRKGGRQIEILAKGDIDINVASASSGYNSAPTDLGEIPLKLEKSLIEGEAMLPLNATDAKGRKNRLSDFLGNYVLLSITAGPESPSWAEIIRLCPVYDRFITDPRLVMLTVHTGDAFPAAARAARDAHVMWRFAHSASPAEIPPEYMHPRDFIYIIDQQGKLVARDLDASQAYTMLDRLLSPSSPPSVGDVTVVQERLLGKDASPDAPYKLVAAPSREDAATKATISIIDGILPTGPNPIRCLNDGEMPQKADARDRNFRFGIANSEGRIRFDLTHVIPIAQINTYSWHTNTRAAQVYKVFGSDGNAPDFEVSPRIGSNPAASGWTLIASVDTRPKSGPLGGRYAVGITRPSGVVGNFRFLLFEIFPTEVDDGNGSTFYSEIDVIEKR